MDALLTVLLPAIAQYAGGALFKLYSQNKGLLAHKIGSPLAVVIVGAIAGLLGADQLLTAEGLLTQSGLVVALHSVLKNGLELIRPQG